MTAKVAILKLAPNNSARFNSSGPTSRSLMQNSSSVYEQQQRIKFGENGEAAERQYRHHHKRKKSKKKRDRSTERHCKSGKSSSSRKNLSEDQQLLYYSSAGASNDMHSVGLPSDGGGVKFDLIHQEDDDDEEEENGGSAGDLLLDGPRHRKRKREHSPSITNGDIDDNNGHASKRINNGTSSHYLFDPPTKSLMPGIEVGTAAGSDEEDDDEDFDLVSEEPYSSYPCSGDVSNNVSVVISTHENLYEEENDAVEVMSDDDDDDEDNNEAAAAAVTFTTASSAPAATLLETNHVEDGPSFANSIHHEFRQPENVPDSLFDEAEDDIRMSDVKVKEYNPIIQEVDEDGEVAEQVTSCSHIDVESLHTERIPNVNGNFDSKGEFHQWHQSYAVESYSGEPLHILPYAVIDF